MAANSASDFEDMNATPLGKLPPMPIMQSKADSPPVDMTANTSYADILRTIKGDQATSVNPQPQPVQLQQPQQGGQAVQGQMDQMQALQAMQAMQAMQYYNPPRQQAPPRQQKRRRSPPPPQRKAQGLAGVLRRALGQYKNAALVIAIVFAVMRWVGPKLAAQLPFLSRPTSQGLSAPGLFLASVLCGGVYRVAELSS